MEIIKVSYLIFPLYSLFIYILLYLFVSFPLLFSYPSPFKFPFIIPNFCLKPRIKKKKKTIESHNCVLIWLFPHKNIWNGLWYLGATLIVLCFPTVKHIVGGISFWQSLQSLRSCFLYIMSKSEQVMAGPCLLCTHE